MRKLFGLLGFLLVLSITPAAAQNPTCPTRPAGDSSNACASTAFVQGQSGGTTTTSSGDYTLASTDCGTTIVLTGNTQNTFTAGAASGFPTVCPIKVVNGTSVASGRGKIQTITGLTFPNAQILWPGQSYEMRPVAGTWTLTVQPGQWKITSSRTFNVDTASGSDSSDCLGTTTQACATLVNAITRQCQHFILNARTTVQLTSGQTHPGQSLCNWTGGADPSSAGPVINGDTTSCTTAGNYTIDGGASLALIPVNIRTPWLVQGLTVASSTFGTTIEADFGSILYIGTNTRFAAVSGFHIRAFYLSLVEVIGNYCINGGAVVHVGIGNQGQFLIQPGKTVTCSAGHAFTIFNQTGTNSLATWAGTTFSGCGTVTGQRFTVDTGGGINTGGGGANFLPGNAAGATTNPGWYF